MDHLAYSYETDGGGVSFRKGHNFRELNGMRFADYVNFKGEGLAHSERYNGQGWGLLQVLLAMENQPDSVLAFATAADWVLTRRANNARNTIEKETWLPGWRKRLTTYTTF